MNLNSIGKICNYAKGRVSAAVVFAALFGVFSQGCGPDSSACEKCLATQTAPLDPGGCYPYCEEEEPLPDSDHDGIVDADDACPASAENFNGYQDGDGCADTVPASSAFNAQWTATSKIMANGNTVAVVTHALVGQVTAAGVRFSGVCPNGDGTVDAVGIGTSVY